MRRTLSTFASALLVLLFVFVAACGGGGGGPTTGNNDSPPANSGDQNPGDQNQDDDLETADATVVEADGSQRTTRIAAEDPEVPESAMDSSAARQTFTVTPVSPLTTDQSVLDGSVKSSDRDFGNSRSASSISANDRVVLQDSINETAADLADAYDVRSASGYGYADPSDSYAGFTWFRSMSENAGNIQGVTTRGLLYATHFDPGANSGSGKSPANVSSDIYTSGNGPLFSGKDGYLGKYLSELESDERPYCQDVVYQVEYAQLAQDPSEFQEAQSAFQNVIDAYRNTNSGGGAATGPVKDNFGDFSPDGDDWDGESGDEFEGSAKNLVERFVEVRGPLAGYDLGPCALAASLTGNQDYAEAILDRLFGPREFGTGTDAGWRDITGVYTDYLPARTTGLGALLYSASRVDFDRYSNNFGKGTSPGGALKRYATELVQNRQERSYGYFGPTENADSEFEEGEYLFDDTQTTAYALAGLSKYLQEREDSGVDGGDPGSTTAQLEIGVDKAQDWLEFFARNDDGSYPSYYIGNSDTTEPSDLNNEVIGEVLWAQTIASENKVSFPSP